MLKTSWSSHSNKAPNTTLWAWTTSTLHTTRWHFSGASPEPRSFAPSTQPGSNAQPWSTELLVCRGSSECVRCLEADRSFWTAATFACLPLRAPSWFVATSGESAAGIPFSKTTRKICFRQKHEIIKSRLYFPYLFRPATTFGDSSRNWLPSSSRHHAWKQPVKVTDSEVNCDLLDGRRVKVQNAQPKSSVEPSETGLQFLWIQVALRKGCTVSTERLRHRGRGRAGWF